jgi:hypothetical protein
MSIYVGRELRKKREKKYQPDASIGRASIKEHLSSAIENGRPKFCHLQYRTRFCQNVFRFFGLIPDAIMKAWDHPDTPFPFEQNAIPQKLNIHNPENPKKSRKSKSARNKNRDEPELPKTENAFFKEIGSELRNRRESLRLTFEDAELHT